MGFGVHQRCFEGNLFREKPAWLTWELCSYMWEGGLCVCVAGGFLPSWAKKLVSRCWPVLGSLGMRVKITGCECLACLGGGISWQVRDTGHLVVDMFRMLLI